MSNTHYCHHHSLPSSTFHKCVNPKSRQFKIVWLNILYNTSCCRQLWDMWGMKIMRLKRYRMSSLKLWRMKESMWTVLVRIAWLMLVDMILKVILSRLIRLILTRRVSIIHRKSLCWRGHHILWEATKRRNWLKVMSIRKSLNVRY